MNEEKRLAAQGLIGPPAEYGESTFKYIWVLVGCQD
jgi:hypothetical protein